SPRHHEERARHYAAAKDWEVVERYDLSGVSGKDVLRHPQAQRMLRDVRTGRISGLIFSKLARLARNTKQLIEISEIFRQHKASLISLGESIDTDTPAGRMFYTILAAMAEWEREEIADRTRSGLHARFTAGRLTGTVPYGWAKVECGYNQQKDRPLWRLEPCPAELFWVRQMAAWRAAGMAYNQIAKELNKRGVPTKRAGEIVRYKGETRIARAGWQGGNVARVLQNRHTQRWLREQRKLLDTAA
ncbi:MAG TPA: recombinase family protein, partial [Verrucomicrobiae bacterium]